MLSTMSHLLFFVVVVIVAFFCMQCSATFTSPNAAQEKKLANEFRKLVAQRLGVPVQTSKDGKLDDMQFNAKQWQFLIAEEKKKLGMRKKRSTLDFKEFPSYKWALPIKYTILPEYGAIDVKRIKKGLAHWEANTCIRFKEVPDSDDDYINNVDKLLFINEDACSSYVGKIEGIQPLFLLAPDCTNRTSTIVHEVGHAIGFFHEHTRQDRDKYINVLWDNIDELAVFQYELMPPGYETSLGVPYDLSSVMHYKSNEFSIDINKNTMEAKDPQLQKAISQHVGLTFSDAKQANLMYCKDKCAVKLPCANGGYTDPNDCTKCKCPDGLGGKLCDTVGCGLGVRKLCCPTNSEKVWLYPYQEVCVETNNCDAGKHYYTDGRCDFMFKAPKGMKVEARFRGNFGIASVIGLCLHWVEIKYKNDLHLRGPRYCGYERPSDVVTSEGDTMVVIMHAVYPNTPEDLSIRKQFDKAAGFKLCVNIAGMPQPYIYDYGNPCDPGPNNSEPSTQVTPPLATDPPLRTESTTDYIWSTRTTTEPSFITGSAVSNPTTTPSSGSTQLSKKKIKKLKKKMKSIEKKIAKLEKKLEKYEARNRIRSIIRTKKKLQKKKQQLEEIKEELGL